MYKCTGCCIFPQFLDAETLVICQEGLCTFEWNEVSYLSIMMGDIAHLRQESHNSKFGIFELLVLKETFADALVTGIVS